MKFYLTPYLEIFRKRYVVAPPVTAPLGQRSPGGLLGGRGDVGRVGRHGELFLDAGDCHGTSD